jgi:formylglycine-generating enzyme
LSRNFSEMERKPMSLSPSTQFRYWVIPSGASIRSHTPSVALIGACAIALLAVMLGADTSAAGILGDETKKLESEAMAVPAVDTPQHPGGIDPKCDCRLEVLRLIAASAGGDNEAALRSTASSALGETVRRVGDLLGSGDAVRAKEIIHEALRECESGRGNRADCTEWSRALRAFDSLLDKPKERIVVNNSLGMKMVRIPPSEYMMGSPKREMDWARLTFRKIWREGHKQWFHDEMPMHPVRITRPFYIGATTVTVGQFREFVRDTNYKTDAEKGDGGMIWSKTEMRWVPKKDMKWDSVPWPIADNQPVVFVSWNDAQAFCRWLSAKEKRTYRLPSEAEWEMSCRGGSVWVRYPWGDRLPGERDSNFGDGDPKLPESLTMVNDGYRYVAPVGSFPPNGFGLYDMAGNVMQWVNDYYDRNYYDESPLENPQGPSTGTSRVNKGGNWLSSPADDRCAFRGFSGSTMSFWNLGFRVAMDDNEGAGRPTDTHESDAVPSGNADLPPSGEQGLRLFRQAVYAAQQEQWDDAVRDLEEALKVYEKREDHQWIARVKATLAGIYAERNRTYKAKELYTQALAGFRRIGDAGSARILLARLRELETSPGVRVVEVQKGGLANKAGIVPGDVIIEYAGDTGFRVSGFKKLVSEYLRANKVTVSVVNNEEISTMALPGGLLGIAVEDIKRPPRARRPPERPRDRDRDRRRPAARQTRGQDRR